MFSLWKTRPPYAIGLHTEKKHEIWFVFAVKPFRFSLREFGILTGLPCGSYPPRETILQWQTPSDPKKPYWDTIFSKEQTIVNIKVIVHWLKRDKRLPAEKKMPSWKRLRLALLVIVEGILLCSGQPVKASREVVEMVKNLETFEEYPWGRESFEQTFWMVKVSNKIHDLDELIIKYNQSHTTTHGFTLSIHLFIFKAIPELEKFIPNEGDEHTFTNQSIIHLTHLNTFHNSNIMETENIPNIRFL